MIPFVLKNLCRIKCFVLFLFLSAPYLYAQPDTVYVYEYVRMVDTVWVETPINCSVDSIPFVPIVGNELGLDARSAFDRSCVDSLFQKKCATLFQNSILNEENLNGTKVKRCTIGGLALCTLITTASAQEPQGRWGFYLNGNLATQVHSYEVQKYYEEIVDGNTTTTIEVTTRESYEDYKARTLGAGARYAYRLNTHWALVGNAGYIQKGCSRDRSTNNSNIFHHLNLDFTAQYRLQQKRFVDPYVYAGLEGSCRMSEVLSYQIDEGVGYYTQTAYSGFNRFNSAYIVGLGIECARKYFVEMELRNDLGYLVKNEYLQVQNQMLSLHVGFYLGKSAKYRFVLGE